MPLLLAPTVNYAREHLTALARKTGGWLGWRALTLRALAEELALGATAGKLRTAGDVELTTLVDRALEELLAQGALPRGIRPLARRPGFRRAITDAVLELRVAGLDSAAVETASAEDSPARVAAQVLARYEALLAAEGLVDPAGLFRLALDRFDAEAPFVLDAEVHIVPSMQVRGLPRQLLDRVVARGVTWLPLAIQAEDVPSSWACALEADCKNLPPCRPAALPSFFSAATPHDELRECLRRASAAGVPFDEVEIAATDPDTYGVALDALARQLGITCTALHGVPWTRTRLGRCVATWFEWLDNGLPADRLRDLLDARAFAERFGEPSPRVFRDLAIGWGCDRYEAALERLRSHEGSSTMRPREGEEPEELEARRQERHAQETVLADFLEALLATTPDVPERGRSAEPVATTRQLAGQALGFLELLATGPGDERLRARLSTRLQGLCSLPEREVTFRHALAELRSALDDLRAWTDSMPGSRPWRSAGGMPHLTDLTHAGTTGRSLQFVVGLDADRAAGPRLPDPILPDAVRHTLGLATTADRRAEQRARVSEALGRLEGTVTVSWARASDVGGRQAGPAPVLLDLWRRQAGQPGATFEEFVHALGDPASPVPASLEVSIGSRDAWLASLAEGGVMRDGADLILRMHPGLEQGQQAAEAWLIGTPGAHHGIVAAAAGALDPRTLQRPISPSNLEQLAKCPLAWFYQRGLGLRAPEDPEYDPAAWLDPLRRGALLHRVFEQFGREWQRRLDRLDQPEAEHSLMAVLHEEVARAREEVPPPSEMVVQEEVADLAWTARSFLHAEREERKRHPSRRWTAFEEGFGYDSHAVAYTLPDGSALPVHGTMDRVDDLGDGRLAVVDYKSGSAYPYRKSSKEAPFRGGRRLQPALYVEAAGQALAATADRFEYRFPSQTGRNEVVAYEAAELEEARPVVASLLVHIERGTFVPTDSASDCKYCDFRPNCRVTEGRWAQGTPVSPRARWAEEVGAAHECFEPMAVRRAKP